MSQGYRIPITAITVFGASLLLTITVGIVLYLGFSQAASSTRQLYADQADTLISAMEHSLEFELKPIRDQALWVAVVHLHIAPKVGAVGLAPTRHEPSRLEPRLDPSPAIIADWAL